MRLPKQDRIAFKEWASVCLALRDGQQSVILRKGGIQEEAGGFEIEHRTFWLLPTYLHQEASGLQPEAASLIDASIAEKPPEGTLAIGEFAVVEEFYRIQHEETLPALRPFHLWSDATVHDRFHYRRPGLTALLVRVYSAEENPAEVPDSPIIAGCRTWVDLPFPLSTTGLKPALTDEQFADLRADFLDSLREIDRA